MNLVREVNYFYYQMALAELQAMQEQDSYRGLSYNSILYINIIAQRQPCTASELAELLGVSKPAVTLKINDLVKQGAVIRSVNSADRRRTDLRLSESMQKTIELYDRVFAGIEKQLQTCYSTAQLEQFAEILHTLGDFDWRRIDHE